MFPTVFTLPPLFGKQNRAHVSTLSPNRANPQIPQFSISKLTQDTVSFGASVQGTHTPVRFGAAMPPPEEPGGGGNPWDGHYEDYEDYLDYSTPQYIPFEAEPDTSSSRPKDPVKAAKRSEVNRAYKARIKQDPVKAEEQREKRRKYEAKRREDPEIAERRREIDRLSKAKRRQDPEKAKEMKKQDLKSKAKKRHTARDNASTVEGSSGQSSNQQPYKRSVFSPPRETRSLLQQHMASHRSSSHTAAGMENMSFFSMQPPAHQVPDDTRSSSSHTASSIAAGMENMSFFSMQPPAYQVPYDTPAPPVPRPDSPPGWRYAADGRWKIFKHPNGCYDSQWTAVTGQTPEPQ